MIEDYLFAWDFISQKERLQSELSWRRRSTTAEQGMEVTDPMTVEAVTAI